MIASADFIWFNGRFVKWDEAQVHFLTHSFHYGGGVFEGIRCNKTSFGPAIFRLEEHLHRLYNSAKIMQMHVPFPKEKIFNACIELVRKNKLDSCYIRPLVYFFDAMGVGTLDCSVGMGIAAWSWSAYLGKKGEEKGIRVKISSFSSHDVNIIMTKSKTSANYATFGLAKNEARLAGYDEAIMLDPTGYVSEGSAENIFIVRDGFLVTPPKANILEGVTRDSIIEIASELNIPFKEEKFSRDMLYTASEAFLCGTASEVVPIDSVDDRQIGTGKPGTITKKIQSTFFNAINGKDKKFHKWLTFVNKPTGFVKK